MRFGIFIPQGWRHDLVDIEPTDQWRVMCALAQRADAAAWESLWVYDHFHTVPVPTDEATHEAWTLMSAFGAATDRIRLFTAPAGVRGTDARHFAVVRRCADDGCTQIGAYADATCALVCGCCIVKIIARCSIRCVGL